MEKALLNHPSDKKEDKARSLRILQTDVKVSVSFLMNLAAMIGCVTWLLNVLHPEFNFWQGILTRFVMMTLFSIAFLGHVVGHIYSARFARSPMDEVLLNVGIPRTLYHNNAVTADVHRIRALGGPVFNLAGLILSLAIYTILPKGSIPGELAAWSALSHAFILSFSLMPLSIVDGGTLIKWSLVAMGTSEGDADGVVVRANWGSCIAIGILGLVFMVLQLWAIGIGLFLLAAILAGIAAGVLH